MDRLTKLSCNLMVLGLAIVLAAPAFAGPTPTATATATPTPTPTPEPGVMLQLVSGSIGLAWLNRRRNRRMTPASRRSG